ncbi:uncharacterized protein LOC128990591 isoform X3 [Macrosteles quadrilineatus]|uniref:uncharacterized protein LOC128990591 isoform X3 n=1 Tax=Macrosteles quadrilineatus TaxID=74068 RepID=UPI0023E1DED6|nr:uncharacterized protein LOC128990591 isoform X3 [Macrosteles quadrilineatus]
MSESEDENVLQQTEQRTVSRKTDNFTMVPCNLQNFNFEGNLAENWKHWYQKFEIYLLASNLNSENDNRKVALLLHNLGDKCIDIFNSFNLSSEDAKKYDVVQSTIFKTILDEEEHAQRREGMRYAYLQHGSEFDPYQIQSPQLGAPGNFQAITGPLHQSLSTWNILLGLEEALDNTAGHLEKMSNKLIGSVQSPPRIGPSQRSAADILSISPPRPPTSVDQHDGMELTPAVSSTSLQTTMLSEHQDLLQRVKNIVEEASWKLNIAPSATPHPLSYGFSSQRRQPLATLYHDSSPGPAKAAFDPHQQSGATATSAPPLTQDDPRLLFRSRVTSRSPLSTRATSPSIPSQRPASPASLERPAQESVEAANTAGKIKGTQAEMEAMGFYGRSREDMQHEFNFVDQFISPYKQSPPQVVQRPLQGHFPGLLKNQKAPAARRKKRVMLKRRVIKIAIPPRPDDNAEEFPFTYTQQDPEYSVRQGELLPPRRLTPSPVNSCYEEGYVRSVHQMQTRRDLETDWDRRQEAVPSREYKEDREKAFGRPLPKSFTTGKLKKNNSQQGVPVRDSSKLRTTPSTSSAASGHPPTPNRRTGLRVPSGRSGSAPQGHVSRSGGRPTRGESASPKLHGGERNTSISPIRGIPLTDRLEMAVSEATEILESPQARVLESPKRVPDFVDPHNPVLFSPKGIDYSQGVVDRLPHNMDNIEDQSDNPIELVRQGFNRVRQRLENLQDLAIKKAKQEMRSP